MKISPQRWEGRLDAAIAILPMQGITFNKVQHIVVIEIQSYGH